MRLRPTHSVIARTVVAGLGLLAAAVVATPTAHATPAASHAYTYRTSIWSSSCQTTSSGHACVTLYNTITMDGYREVSFSFHPVFAVTPFSGKVMSPVSWTAVDPTRADGQHRLCAASCASSSSRAYAGPRSDRESVYVFTYNIPGQTYRVAAGLSMGESQDPKLPANVHLETDYYAKANVLYARYDLHATIISGNEPEWNPRYVRLFTKTNSTLFARTICPASGCAPFKGYYTQYFPSTFVYDAIAKPVGAA